MAAVNVSALAPVTPAAQRSPADSGTSQAAEPAGQPSFAQVLKSRSQATEAPKTAHAATEAKPSKATEAADDAKNDLATDTTQEKDTLLSAMLQGLDPNALALSASVAAAASGTATVVSPPLAEDALALTDKGGDTQTAATLAAPASALLAATANTAAKTSGSELAEGQGKKTPLPSTALASADLQQNTQASDSATNDKPSAKTTGALGASQTDALPANNKDLGKTNSFANELATANQALNQAGPETTPLNAAQHVAQTLQAQRTAEPLPQHQINTPVAAHGWADEVGQKISWIAGRDNGHAELVLTPPSLGKIEISISMNGDQASASFIAASPAAREALQDALPRLREMLAQTGIQLGQANVNAGNSGQTQADDQTQRNMAGRLAGRVDSLNGLADSDISSRTQPWTRQGKGMVDTFA